MELTRRNILGGALLGGALVGTGALTACSKSSNGQAASATPSGSGTIVMTSGLSSNEVTPLALFASSAFNDEALFALGAASSQTAEVGEVIRIAQRIGIASGDPAEPDTATFNAYYNEFGAYADQLDQLARSSARHAVTARNRMMRASMYAAQQLFFVLGTDNGSREESIFDTCQQRWLAAIDSFTPKVEKLSVASDFGPLPVYFFPATGGGRRPTVIISEGSDGQNVETMQFGVTAGLERGYNVVLFEGPGQMSLLFKKQIPFTADWQKVVGPILQSIKKRPDVGKVALIGISFAGMLCARPAAKLTGLDAVVLEPGAWSFTQLWGDQETVKTVEETQNAPAPEKAEVQRKVNEGFLQAWPGMTRTAQFTIYKRGEIMAKQVQDEARAGQPISNYYGLIEAMLPFNYEADYREITIPTMVTANEGDEFFAAQGKEAFAMLEKVPSSRKTFQQLTAAQGASLHDQPTGPQVAEEFVFDWLDDQLR